MTEDDTDIELTDTQILDGEPAEPGHGAPTTDELRLGDVVADRYELLDRVGEGGMGRVYKAEDLTLHEMVALKVLHVEAAADEEVVEQFRREVKLARRVAHPNVVRTFDIDSADGTPFLTMEYVKGPDLREVMNSDDFGLRQGISAARAIAAGLEAAHDTGVLHRDLKPENVLIGESGRVALTDFGIAGALRDEDDREHLRRRGIGTPAYMAPEQVRGQEAMDERVDVYALGVLLYEMIGGEVPWSDSENATELAMARLDESPPSLAEFAPSAPRALVELVDQSLKPDPDDRPAEIGRLQRILDELADPSAERPELVPGPSVEARSATDPARPGAHSRLRTESQRIRLVVLPFDVDDSERAAEVATGLREDLLYRLGRWQEIDIRLREPTNTEASGARHSSLDIGRQLDADAVVTGSVENTNQGLRGRLALDAISTGDQIWGDVRTFEPADSYDVASLWAEEIGGELSGTEPESERESLPNPAHALLNEAQHLMRERWRVDIEPAIERLERARDLASKHPRVLSLLAIGYARLAFQEPAHRDAHVERAVSLAREAIDRSEDTWAEPRYALAMAHFNGRSYGRAVATLRAALERVSDYAEVHELLGRIHSEIGPLERATDHLERALGLNPYLHRALPDLMRVHALAGRWSKVDDLADRPLESTSHRLPRAQLATRLRLWNDRPSLRRVVDAERAALAETDARIVLETLDRGGMTDDIRATIEQRLEEEPNSRRKTVLAQASTEVAIDAGEQTLALTYLDHAVEAGLSDLQWLENCPLFEPMRDSPAFLRRLERIRGRVEALELQ
ncbi:MAG: protein kinase [Bradymonadaceae bacterium]